MPQSRLFRILLLFSSAISYPCWAAAAAAYGCDPRLLFSGSKTSRRAGQLGAQTGVSGAALPPDEHGRCKERLLFSVPAARVFTLPR